jgi:hypothetical protein
MWRTRLSLFFAVVLVLAIAWSPAYAQTAVAPGSGPEAPVGAVAEWTELSAGASRWHAFYFSHPHAMRSGETADIGAVNVRLESVPNAAAKFEVLTPKEVALWAKAEKYTPVGVGSMSCGCKPEDAVRRLNWTGVPYGHELTYILVKNVTQKPLYYRLLIDENKYVSFPAPIAAMAAPDAAALASGGEPMTQLTTEPDKTVALAAAVPGEWFNLQPGTERWFEFNYNADTGVKHDQKPAMAEFTLFVERDHPLDSVFFDVFTDAEYRQLIQNGEDITGEDGAKGTAVGCGSENGAARGELNWRGSFPDSQTLHVRVREGTCHTDGLNVMLEAQGKMLQPLAATTG